MKRLKFFICSVYDTETTNILDAESAIKGKVENTRAFPILFIDNDIRDVDLRNYKPDVDDRINFYRTEDKMIERIKEYVEYGKVCKEIPIVCAYNLMFDLHPLMESLDSIYDIQANAQSSTNVYTLDLYDKDNGNIVLRFWDTFHLEMRGLAAMGLTCGFEKAVGDWDYSLIRTPQTELTDLELFYARRDVQVIPAYLCYLLHANEWMNQKDFGFKIITKTSIVRQMAKKQIGKKVIRNKEGKCLDLRKCFLSLCKQELPYSYGSYALRKSCFRGGFTFTSAAWALIPVQNVVSVDVTSMHHTFINGRKIPVKFGVSGQESLMLMCNSVLGTTLEKVMENYHQPFEFAFHARLRIRGISLKRKSCFSRWGIGLLAQSKFHRKALSGGYDNTGESAIEATQAIMDMGFRDRFSDDAVFAFGKLYSASEIVVHVSEIELWCMSRVYEWESLEVIGGEATGQFILPPDYVTAQSNMLYKQKDKAKFISNHYVQGAPYPYNLEGIPEGIAESLRNGTCEKWFFDSWYTSTVKGMFNGIYGTMAQDQYKPKYTCSDGELIVDGKTLTTVDNFDEKTPKSSMVLYTYGLRIVAGSRMHMVIAMELIDKFFGSRVDVLGGDTDSMKMRCDFDVSDYEIEESLKPIGEMSKKAIDTCMVRLRSKCSEFASPLTGIGGFEIENKENHYQWHIEGWNKYRVSFDSKAHVTCAGLSRPANQFNIEKFINSMVEKYEIPKVLKKVVGFNTFISHDISHSLEAHHPKVSDRYVCSVTDYQGKTCEVNVHESTSLYPIGRWLGETLKLSNMDTMVFLRDTYKREIDDSCRFLTYSNGVAKVQVEYGSKMVTEMEVKI